MEIKAITNRIFSLIGDRYLLETIHLALIRYRNELTADRKFSSVNYNDYLESLNNDIDKIGLELSLMKGGERVQQKADE